MRIIPTAISALLLCGEVMSFESYVPQEFWGNVEVLKPNLEEAVEYAQERTQYMSFFVSYGLYRAGTRYMCQYLYPKMEEYMRSNGSTNVPTEEEFWGSIGYSNLRFDSYFGKSGDIEIEDVLKFLDNVKSVIGDFHF